MPRELTSKELGGLLCGIHSHADIEGKINPDQIVYREEDIILLLRALGYPEPEWGDMIKLDDYINSLE